MSYKLRNAESWSKKYPSFEIPSSIERHNLKSGAHAKLVFLSGKNAERMWVKVTKVSGKKYEGKLDNSPVVVKGVKLGSKIKFGPQHVIDIMKSNAKDNPPKWVKTSRDKRLWKEAEGIVKKEYKVKVGSDRFYALVNGIFQRMKHRVGGEVAPNPSGFESLGELYEEFHGVQPRYIDEFTGWIPGSMVLVGVGVDVGYHVKDNRSNKGDSNYVHDLGDGVKIWRRPENGETGTKKYSRFPKSFMVLGQAIGFTFKLNGEDYEFPGNKSLKLCAASDAKTVVVMSSKGVEFLIKGGNFRVEDWLRG